MMKKMKDMLKDQRATIGELNLIILNLAEKIEELDKEIEDLKARKDMPEDPKAKIKDPNFYKIF